MRRSTWLWGICWWGLLSASNSVIAMSPLTGVQEQVVLQVRVDGFADDTGMAGIAVWTDRKGFPEAVEYALQATYVAIDHGLAEATFELPARAPADYAVTVYHDANDNRRFDRNWIGVPREAWGVSNNVRPRLRAPRFEEARVTLTPGKQVVRVSVEK